MNLVGGLWGIGGPAVLWAAGLYTVWSTHYYCIYIGRYYIIN